MEEKTKEALNNIIERELPRVEDYRETAERKLQAGIVVEKGLPEVFEFLAENFKKRVGVHSAIAPHGEGGRHGLQVTVYIPPFNFNTAIICLTTHINEFGIIYFGYQVGNEEQEYISAIDPLAEDLESLVINTARRFVERIGKFLARKG